MGVKRALHPKAIISGNLHLRLEEFTFSFAVAGVYLVAHRNVVHKPVDTASMKF
jgi:hypothetical protein